MNNLNKITLAALLAIFSLFGLAGNSAMAQVPVDENGIPVEAVSTDVDTVTADVNTPVLLTVDELEQIVGPVALYPDELLAIVLPASTYPIQIVLAARFLDDLETDSTLKPDEGWDDSIIALLNYPEVVRKMNADLDWTTQLGDAVLDQQADVIAAVEQFRDRAYAAGNLKTDDHQVVKSDGGIIEITPIEEDVIYVPYYEPERVIVYQATPAYYYYPRPYPVYYYPYADDYYFASGFFWGVTSAYHLSWQSHYLSVYHHSYHGHPYYGHDYGYHYYRRPDVNVYVNNYYGNNRSHNYSNRDRDRDGDRWQANTRNYQGGRGGRTHSDRERRRDANLSRERQREPGRDSVDRSRLRTMADPENTVSRRSAGSLASNLTAEAGSTGRTRQARNDSALRERPDANNQVERNATNSGTDARRPVRRQTDVPATAFRQRPARSDAAISSDLTRNTAPTRTTEQRASQSRRTDRQRPGLVQSETRNPAATNTTQRRSSTRQVERPAAAPEVRARTSNARSTQPRSTAVTRQAAPRSTERPASQVQRTQRPAPVSSSRPTPAPRAAPAPRSAPKASPQARPAPESSGSKPAVAANKERRQKSRQKD